MSEGLTIASTGVLVKLWWVCAVAVVWVVLYRAAFPRNVDEAMKAARQAAEAGVAPPMPVAAPAVGAPLLARGPVVDTRPRMRCPRCEELIPVEARLCRFCGYRPAGPAKL
jgi:hypothetical protein